MNTININHRAEKLHHKVHRHAKHHVHRLRGKSDTHKKVFAFSFAFVVTLFVFMLWYFLSLPKILDAYRVTKSENERLKDSPVDKFKNIFKGENAEIDPNINNIEVIQ
jgi:hypothetical protein